MGFEEKTFKFEFKVVQSRAVSIVLSIKQWSGDRLSVCLLHAWTNASVAWYSSLFPAVDDNGYQD